MEEEEANHPEEAAAEKAMDPNKPTPEVPGQMTTI